MLLHSGDEDLILFNKTRVSTIDLPQRRFQTYPDISLPEQSITYRVSCNIKLPGYCYTVTKGQMYPAELEVKETTESNTSACYLD